MAYANEFIAKRVQKFTYDVAVHGGTENTAIEIGRLPANALIVGGYAKVTTAFSDSDNGNDTTISIGYTGAAAAFYAATAVSSLTDNVILRLLPGVINIGSGQAITTIDTPAEAVAVGRVSGDTFGIINLTAEKSVLITISDSDTDLDAGKIDIFIEYVISE